MLIKKITIPDSDIETLNSVLNIICNLKSPITFTTSFNHPSPLDARYAKPFTIKFKKEISYDDYTFLKSQIEKLSKDGKIRKVIMDITDYHRLQFYNERVSDVRYDYPIK